MPTPSQSITLPQAPIKRLPYDVLQEIFMHCIPNAPSSELGPMLCQICSFWRMVALTSPKLWSHLSFHLYIYYTERSFLSASSMEFRKNQIEYLQWWDKNRGSIPPFLSIDISIIDRNQATDRFDPRIVKVIKPKDRSALLDGDSEAAVSVLNFITSAQYIDADKMLWYEIRRRMERGDQILFPNLRTIVQRGNRKISQSPFIQDQVHIGAVGLANNVLPPLRHLHLERLNIMAIYLRNSPIPLHWSTLTHISFFDVHISLHFWRSLIRSVPNLEWGYFNIRKCDYAENGSAAPQEYSHSNLTTLFAIFACKSIALRLSSLFTHLHLPNLQSLTLHSDHRAWMTTNDDAINELYTIVQSAPNISTLGLNSNFLCLNYSEYNPSNLHIVEPIWSRLSHLAHLQLEMFNRRFNDSDVNYMERLFDRLTHNLFADDKWLQLDHPACPIRKITLIDAEGLMKNSPWFATSHVHQVARDMPFIDIQVTSKSGVGSFRQTWKEWRARLL